MITNGTTVCIRISRCACVGGGFSEEIGKVIQVIETQNNTWYKVNHPNGISTVKAEDIIRIME